jgi:predicted DNA-binding transcriptional regulator YafY
LVTAWCELRDDYRHFRADRVEDCDVLDEGFPISGKELFARWQDRFVTAQPRAAPQRQA